MYGSTLPLGVEDPMFLENFSDDRDCRVHGVGDNKDICFRGSGCDACSKIAYDSSVDLRVVSN